MPGLRELERDLEFPGPGGQLPRVGTPFEPDPYADVRARKIWIIGEGRRLDMAGWRRSGLQLDRLQLDLEEMRAESRRLRTPGGRDSPNQPRQVTSTKEPKFAGVISWEQYRQVFDVIVQSNGWDDATAALQLLSHLEGDALNAALLVPESR